MTTLDPGTIEVPQQWRATNSRAGWRWPVRYTSIPAVVCIFDVFLILTTAVLAGNLLKTNVDLSRYAMTAIVIAAIFVPALYNRGLYSPVALVKLKSQIRNILGLWTIAFLAFASVAFALKVGSDLSRGAVLLFGIIGLIAILFHRVLWRRATENDNVNTLALRTNGGQPPSGPASC